MSALLQTEDVARGFGLSALTGQAAAVRLSWGGAVDCAAAAAMALGEEAAWLDALDDWLAPAQGLDWQPEAAPAPAGWIAATALRDERALRLSLPWALLQRLPAPPVALGLRWPVLAAELLLARQPLPPEGLGALTVGSVLLLEASFGATWPAVLRRPAEREGRAVACEGQVARLLAEPAAPASPAGPHIDVRMALPSALPLPMLAGWATDAAVLPLDAPLTLHVHDGPERAIAEGHLLPWGRGHAMRVTRLLDDPVC